MSMAKSLLFNRSVLSLLIGACTIVGAMDLYLDNARIRILDTTAIRIAEDDVKSISQLIEANKKINAGQTSDAIIKTINDKMKTTDSGIKIQLINTHSPADEFQKNAIQALAKNPKSPYYMIGTVKNESILRYATVSPLLSEAGSNTPGIMEINLEVKPYEDIAYSESAKILWAMIFIAVSTTAILAVFMGQLRSASDVLTETNHTLEQANKKLEQEHINEVKRSQDLATAKNETEKINAQLQTAIYELRTLVQEIQTSAGVINSAAGEIAVGNNDLSKRTDEQAAVLEETSASITELTSAVKQNVENAKQVRQMAEQAYNVAVKGGKAVSQVINTMSTIHESSHKIVDIITVIDNIAFQTNMLALNAAVEAARAGEQGRGFGVVASEIRNLAQHTATAAKEIKSLISDSVDQIRNGTGLVDDAGHTMEEIMTSSKQVSDIIANIVSASIEQSTGIEQVNEAISRIDATTQQNAALVRQSAAVAESLESHTRHMESLVNLFDSNTAIDLAAVSKSSSDDSAISSSQESIDNRDSNQADH